MILLVSQTRQVYGDNWEESVPTKFPWSLSSEIFVAQNTQIIQWVMILLVSQTRQVYGDNWVESVPTKFLARLSFQIFEAQKHTHTTKRANTAPQPHPTGTSLQCGHH